MRRLILGTAGHIDHGKTALVRALTGTDTDRLKEEKERGVTIDLGFAELILGDETEGRVHLGVVDVPGHEGFVKNMVAGATGMDLVLLVIAADEGVMPQTAEHLSILRFLGVSRVVVALSKADRVDAEWLEMVREEVGAWLRSAGFDGVSIVPTSVSDGTGLESLREALTSAASDAEPRVSADLVRLPIDRVFTVKGTGTVVTGTLWSGRVGIGDRLFALPAGFEDVRIRAIQTHGRAAEQGFAGERVAAAVTGRRIHPESFGRGQVLLGGAGWTATGMVTAHLSLRSDSAKPLGQRQRVRVHHGTSEVMARVVLLDEGNEVLPGGEGWVQLRLESPLVCRSGDRFVVRSYSPVNTIAGGVVLEPAPPKRRVGSLAVKGHGLESYLETLRSGDPGERVVSVVYEAGWKGVPRSALPVLTGATPEQVDAEVEEILSEEGFFEVEGRLFSSDFVEEGMEGILRQLAEFHEEEPLRSGLSASELGQNLGRGISRIALRVPDNLVAAMIDRLLAQDRIEKRDGVLSLTNFQRTPDQAVDDLKSRLLTLIRDGGLSPPLLPDFPAEFGGSDDLTLLLQLLEEAGKIKRIDRDLFFAVEVLEDAERAVREALGGHTGLGPGAFRSVLDTTRKYLIPILRHLDSVGVTRKKGTERSVPQV